MALKNGASVDNIGEIVLCIVKTLKSGPSDESRAWCLTVLDTACRQMEVFVTPEVSVRAQQEATDLGLGTLKQYKWSDQPGAMGDTGRKIFHWEHIFPVAEMKRRLLELEHPTIDNVREILLLADIAWILKIEDSELTRLNLGHRRPGNPRDAYQKANIELLP